MSFPSKTQLTLAGQNTQTRTLFSIADHVSDVHYLILENGRVVCLRDSTFAVTLEATVELERMNEYLRHDLISLQTRRLEVEQRT